jgi:hypothetical protein
VCIGATLYAISAAWLCKQIHVCIYRNICDPRCVLFLEGNRGNCFSKIRHSASHRRPSDVLKEKCTTRAERERERERVFIFFLLYPPFFVVASLFGGSGKGREKKGMGGGVHRLSIFTLTVFSVVAYTRSSGTCIECACVRACVRVSKPLYSSPNIIRVIKSRRLRWAGHVAGIAERRGAYRTLVGKPEVRNHLEERDVDGRIILKWIFERLDVGVGHRLDRSGSGTGGVM